MTASVEPSRLWLVLVLLVGLLGMHGLASDHADMGAPQAATLSASFAVDRAAHAGMAMTVPVVAATTAAGSRVTEPDRHGAMALAGLCLAVLTVVLLLAAAASRLKVRRRPDAARGPSGLAANVWALPPPRPPDLVAGLCVSRT